jgi:glycyl-tRNA synthetase
VRITRDQKRLYSVDPKGFIEEAEKALFTALEGAEHRTRLPGSVDDFLTAIIPMLPAINDFFDKVLVMTEEKTIRANRLGLLQRIAALADGVADLSKLEGF